MARPRPSADAPAVAVYDVGNTTISLTVFAGMDAAAPVLEKRNLVHGGAVDAAAALPGYPARHAFVCSVVPELDKVLCAVLRDAGLEVLRLDSAMPCPVRNPYREPATLGTDRLAAAVGARLLFPDTGAVIVDAGTATTVDGLRADGGMTGGYIVPGPGTWLRSLRAGTAQLPEVSFGEGTGCLPGLWTAECIAHGLGAGYPAMLAGLYRQVARDGGFVTPPVLLACGGWGAVLAAPLARELNGGGNVVVVEQIPDLVARGALCLGLWQDRPECKPDF